MPPKRPHKKSRAGCDQCRKRRVKCDESKPRCTSCTYRDEDCRYIRPQLAQRDCDTKGKRSSSRSSPSTLIHDATPEALRAKARPVYSSATLNPPKPPASDPIPITDLALMHHWCTRTCLSFTPAGADLFRDHVGQEALRFDYLMEALLALTLLHVASEINDTVVSQPYLDAALQHQNRALSGLRATLGDISTSNCDAIFASSILIMVCAIVSPLLPTCDNNYPAKSTTESMLSLVDFIKGIAYIIRLSREWLERGPISAIFGLSMKKSPTSQDWLLTKELRLLTDLNFTPDSHKHQIFNQAIKELEVIRETGKSMVIWLVVVGTDFMDELRSGDLVAMSTFMCWGMLLYKADGVWWAQYSGRRLVEDVSSTLIRCGSEWGSIATQCRKVVGLST
jgi:hypothetical protein